MAAAVKVLHSVGVTASTGLASLAPAGMHVGDGAVCTRLWTIWRAAPGRQPSRGGLTYEHLESTQEPPIVDPRHARLVLRRPRRLAPPRGLRLNAVIDCDHL
ncbi:MAG: hypothetical protein ACT4NY_30305 [Pseudonocardiales bacterium]